MAIRELSNSEVEMVSGGFCGTADWSRPETGAHYLAGLEKFKKLANCIDSSRDWQYVAATNPCLSKPLEKFIDTYGIGGAATVASWASGCIYN